MVDGLLSTGPTPPSFHKNYQQVQNEAIFGIALRLRHLKGNLFLVNSKAE